MKSIILKICITGITIVAGGVMLFGVTDGKIRLKAATGAIVESVNDFSSNKHLVDLAKLQLDEGEKQIIEAEAKVKVFRDHIACMDGEIANLADCAKVARARLGLLQPVLKGEAGFFTLHGVNYSRAEAETEARRLLAALDGYEKKGKLKAAQAKEIRRAIASGDSALDAARGEFDGAKGRLAKLELELDTAQTVSNVTAAAGLVRDSINSGTASSAMNTLQKRLAIIETANDHAAGTHSGGISWGRGEAAPLADAVDAALHAGTAPAPVPVKAASGSVTGVRANGVSSPGI